MLCYIKRFLILIIGLFTGITIRLLNDPWTKIEKIRKETGKNILFLLWHESIAGPVFFYRYKKLGLLREASRKGDDFAFYARFFGYKEFGVTDNSADKETVKGTLKFIKYLREGHDGNITIDGPNGPYHQPKPGVFQIAEKSALAVVPVGVWYSSKVILKNRWDKFQWPLPFSRWIIEIADPYQLPPDFKDRQGFYLKELTAKMQEVNKAAEEKGRKFYAKN